jgi:hypothetical protein
MTKRTRRQREQAIRRARARVAAGRHQVRLGGRVTLRSGLTATVVGFYLEPFRVDLKIHGQAGYRDVDSREIIGGRGGVR